MVVAVGFPAGDQRHRALDFCICAMACDRSRDDNDKRHKANEVQALIDAIGHTGAVNALTRRGG